MSAEYHTNINSRPSAHCLTPLNDVGATKKLASSTTGSQHALNNAVGGFSWCKLASMKDLTWTTCYDGHECARLMVPLDYADPDGRQASIALLRKPAAVSKDSGLYRGPILINPGGPGASGVDMVINWGDRFSKILGPQFDLVGFDPRGVARSTPGVTFFKTEAEAALWWQQIPTAANNSNEGIARPWAQGRLLGQLAVESDDGYLRHINSENTAQDMLSIVNAHGLEKLQYWGFSYGTVLGLTFATLFPDKVERIAVDGVVDIEDFFQGLYLTGFEDTNKALKSFFTGCADTGPDNCPFWAPTADDIERNLTTILQSLRSRPIPVRTERGYGLFDYSTLRDLLFSLLYKPYAFFPLLAQGLADLARGDASLFFDISNSGIFECKCDEKDAVSGQLREANAAIHCNDGGNYLEDLDAADGYLKQLAESTSWADGWAMKRLFCASWPKFHNRILHGPINVSTSHPILLIGTTADPVTPLRGAKKMSTFFDRSVVLTQDSAGHGSVSAPSTCTQKYIRDYFVSGSLPPPDTVCRPDVLPFPPADLHPGPHSSERQVAFDASFSSAEREIFAAVHAMSKDRHGPVSKPLWSM
ncbi:hypothetical protein D9619_008075 [Psilocybe cf. subviscida]|uniref:AB hydrolase-1 domain-containing protein n=1 Tax=Psilocybe cf. subviscida TaxID=2480587 RepID=A0A8H5ESW1_9AGAR|nr:hypothetical protein D9619_008075 [Psilocybe cf. subviscida]